jgi:hypothetical protein
MPTKPLSRKLAQQAVDAVNDALRKGYKPPDALRASHEITAVGMAARSLNLPSGTMFNRLLRAKSLHGMEPDWSIYVPPPQKEIEEKSTVDHRETIRLKDEISNLRRLLIDAQRDAIDGEAIKELLHGVVSAPVEPPNWLVEHKSPGKALHVPMVIWSDWHCGEVVSLSETNGQNEFNTQIFERRVRRLVEKTIHLCRHHGPGNYPGIVINLLGDMVSGALHAELLKTDEEEVIPSALRVRDILAWALGVMADEFGRVYVPCTSGNHGRNTMKPQFKRTVFENFDWLIYQLLARTFAKDKRITFDIPDSNEVSYKVYGFRFLAMHGDMLGVKGGDGIIGSLGPILRGEMKVGKQASAMGRHYDVLLLGHWHQHIMLRRIIVAGTLKGWDEFAAKALRAPPAPPSQPLWFVERKVGIVQSMEVYLEDNPTMDAGKEWVAWTR